ncbi:hypothetical protein D9M72_92520 [compost metagenome]
MSTGEQPPEGGVTPALVLKSNPAPWNTVTYSDGTIRVYDATGREVGLLSILAFAVGLANATTVRRPEGAAA